MERKQRFWIYVAVVTALVVVSILLWHYYMDQIIRTLGWILVFVLVFGAGVVFGWVGCRRTLQNKDE